MNRVGLKLKPLSRAQIEAVVYVLKETTRSNELAVHYGAIFFEQMSAADVKNIAKRFENLPRLEKGSRNLDSNTFIDKVSGRNALLIVATVLEKEQNRILFRIAQCFGQLGAQDYLVTMECTCSGWRVASFEKGFTS